MGVDDRRKDKRRAPRRESPQQQALEAMAELRRVIEEMLGQRVTPVPSSGVVRVAGPR